MKFLTYQVELHWNRFKDHMVHKSAYLSHHHYPNSAAAQPAFASVFWLRRLQLLPVLSSARSSHPAVVLRLGQPRSHWHQQVSEASVAELEGTQASESKVLQTLTQLAFHFPSQKLLLQCCQNSVFWMVMVLCKISLG